VVLGKEGAQEQDGTVLVTQAVMGAKELAHQRMGHVSESTLKQMQALGALQGLELGGEDMPPCQVCMIAKMKQAPFPENSSKRADAALELVHMDMWGPARVATMGGKGIYVLSLIDDHSRYVWSVLLPSEESKGIAQALEEWRVKAERA